MSRIRKGYEAKLRSVLDRFGARKRDRGIAWLLARAERITKEEQLAPADALTRVYDALRRKAGKRKRAGPIPERFFCDAGLGGLARWLRAAGYETLWVPGIDDKILLNEARNNSAALLTTDSMLMEHGVLRDGVIPAFWLPPTLSIREQLETVFVEFGLVRRAPRCTHCAGELKPADKEALKERIPPRTYRWLDEYFVCQSCGKLFWHGTHWQRILKTLKELESPRPSA